jgi:hypothetical protein
MFWALARVSFRAAKIVSCNKNIFFSWSTIKITTIVLLYYILQLLYRYCIAIRVDEVGTDIH